MLGRRNLRIKVMQQLYAWEMDHEIPVTRLEQQLKTQIQKSLSLYCTNLLYLVEVCRYSTIDKEKRLTKYLKTEEDEKTSTAIAFNTVIAFLQNDAQFSAFVKKDGVKNFVSEDIVKGLYNE